MKEVFITDSQEPQKKIESPSGLPNLGNVLPAMIRAARIDKLASSAAVTDFIANLVSGEEDRFSHVPTLVKGDMSRSGIYEGGRIPPELADPARKPAYIA